ncbi:MAG: glycosyltransferase family 39 protein [Solirubrobacteraceae bacterium]
MHRLARLQRTVARRLTAPLVWPLALVTLLATALRIPTLGQQSLWQDEAYTWSIVSGPWNELLDHVRQSEVTPPLVYVVLKAWTGIVGLDAFLLRLPLAIFGVAAAATVVIVVFELTASRAPAAFAGVLMATSPMLVWYSQEARSYELMVLLAALSALCALRVHRGGGRRWLARWALCCAAALLTHYFAVGFVVPEALALIWLRPVRRLEMGIAVAALLACAVLLIPLARAQAPTGAWVHGVPLTSRLGQTEADFVLGPSSGASWTVVDACAAFALLVIALGWRASDAASRRLIAIMCATSAALLAEPLAAVMVGEDFFNARNVIVALLPLLVALALALVALRRVGVALLVAVAVVWSVLAIAPSTFEPWAGRPNWAGLAAALPTACKGDVLITTPAATPLEIYEPLPPRSGMAPTRTLLVAKMRSSTAAVASPPSPPGFRRVAQLTTDTFVLVTYRSPTPRVPDRAAFARWLLTPTAALSAIALPDRCAH